MSNITNILTYSGSSGYCRPVYVQAAKELGREIALRNKKHIYGGTDTGLMCNIADEVLAYGGYVTGVIPRNLAEKDRIHPNLTETILIEDMCNRKLDMLDRADAAIAMPGGFGTADEFFEFLHWGYLGSHTKPLVLLNIDGYYDDLIEFMNTLPDLSRDHLIVANTVDEAFAELDKWTSPAVTVKHCGTPFPNFENEVLQSTNEPIIIREASVENIYKLTTALDQRQLGEHYRAIGLLNDNGQFDSLLKWLEHAQKETFITERCTKLFSADATPEGLDEKLAQQPKIKIDLNNEKWGDPPTDQCSPQLREIALN